MHLRLKSHSTGCQIGRCTNIHAHWIQYILKPHSASVKNKLILMVKRLQCSTHPLTGQTNICYVCKAYGPPNPLMLNQACTHARETNEVSLSSTEDETLHHQSMCICLIKLFARGHIECKWIGLCVPASISVQTAWLAECLMMKWLRRASDRRGH